MQTVLPEIQRTADKLQNMQRSLLDVKMWHHGHVAEYEITGKSIWPGNLHINMKERCK